MRLEALRARTPFGPLLGLIVTGLCLAATIATAVVMSRPNQRVDISTVRTPLVLIGGKATPLPAGDTLSGVPSNSTPINVVTKSDGSNLVASSIGDDGTLLSMCSSTTLGCGVSDAGKFLYKRANGEIFQQYTPIGPGPTASEDAYTISNVGVATTSIESGGFQDFITTTFDTTAAGAQAIGFLANVSATRVAGSNPLTNYGVISNAGGADNNYSWYSTVGTMSQAGDVVFGPGAVTLGSHVTPFVMPGSSSQVAYIDLGYTGGTDGAAIHTKNTVPTATITGFEAFLDTTIEPNVRGGLIINRGAGGGTSNNMGVVASISNYPFVGSSANEFAIYSNIGAAITFGADDSGFTSASTLTRSNHWVQNASTGTPTLDAGCTSGGSSLIVGNDNRFELTTGATSVACVITFKKTWTTKPICNVTTEGGIALPTYTVSATAITSTVNVASGVYNVDCQGQPGST